MPITGACTTLQKVVYAAAGMPARQMLLWLFVQITLKQNVINAPLRQVIVQHPAEVFFDGSRIGRIQQKLVRLAAQVIIQGVAQRNELVVNLHAHPGALTDS